MSHEITTVYTHETADELARCIITQALADDMNVPYVPAGNRFHIKTSIILMDKVAPQYIVEKVGVLDFWNEVSDSFISTSIATKFTICVKRAEKFHQMWSLRTSVQPPLVVSSLRSLVTVLWTRTTSFGR